MQSSSEVFPRFFSALNQPIESRGKGDEMTKYGMVIDLTRCAGCQTCVVSCQLTNNQRPGIAWGTVEAVEMGSWPDSDRLYLPHACMHCDDAPCVEVCPTGASTKRDDGIVVVDYDVCIGCASCDEACPYGARRLSKEDVWFFDAETPAPYETVDSHPVGVSEKCIFCYGRVDNNLQPMCVASCPTKARVFGDLDDASSEIHAYISETGAVNMPGTAIYYVKGNHDFDVASVIMSGEAPVVKSDPPEEKKGTEGFDPLVVGVGGAVVVAAAAGIGVAVKKSKDKAKVGVDDAKDGE